MLCGRSWHFQLTRASIDMVNASTFVVEVLEVLVIVRQNPYFVKQLSKLVGIR